MEAAPRGANEGSASLPARTRVLFSNYNGTFTKATVVFTTKATRPYRLKTSNALGVSPDVWTNSALNTFAPDAGSSTTKIIA